MAHLTIHILDTFTGEGAAGAWVEFSRRDGEAYTPIARFAVDAKGRAPAPLLEGDELPRGAYQIEIHAGAYYAARGQKPSDGAALDIAPIRFSIFDGKRNYHLPVLFSPYGYTTYLGQ
ncbi:MAG: hydroxyisourate hydrolase [Alphaproteobacteria bacterium]|nr:hydroxyisourate hydrolase [Alphaproteobacteria bacterium]